MMTRASAQWHQAGHMLPAGPVFETPALTQRLQNFTSFQKDLKFMAKSLVDNGADDDDGKDRTMESFDFVFTTLKLSCCYFLHLLLATINSEPWLNQAWENRYNNHQVISISNMG